MVPYIQTIIHLIEAAHDSEVIAGSNRSETIHNRRWHQYDALMWLVIHGLIAYLTKEPFYLISGLMIRFYLLQVALNHLRGLSSFYLADKGMDGWCKRKLGQQLTFYIKLTLFLSVFVYEKFILQ